MVRPDEARFQTHVKHMEALDPILEDFCRGRGDGFILQKNLYRIPCRVLRRRGNPEPIIDIYELGDWSKLEYNENLPHTMGIAAYYQTDGAAYYQAGGNREVQYRKTLILYHEVTFGELLEYIEEGLQKALGILSSWTEQDIVRTGECISDVLKSGQAKSATNSDMTPCGGARLDLNTVDH
jgi:hypothetical protein